MTPIRGRSWLWFVVLLVLALGASFGGWSLWRSHHHAVAGKRYQCPMHPTITSDQPGTCPICGMNLVEIGAQPQSGGGRNVAFYRSPMDPKQTSPTPQKDSMGMDYVPVYEDEIDVDAGESVPGLATVTLDTERQQLIGLRVTPVTKGPVAGSWRTVARLQVDPRRVRRTNVKVEGYVERMYVDFVGRRVRIGEPLFAVYSPSLLATENELLLALQARDAGVSDLGVGAARRKLELWDVPAPELDRLERTGRVPKTLTFVSPIAGVVTAKNVVEGARVGPGDAPFEITDLDIVWAMVDVYETDVQRVAIGTEAVLTLRAYPGRTFKGTVDFVDPLLDPATRTVKVHIHLPNASGELKPEMIGEVQLSGKARDGLRIPAAALIRAGTKDVVFLALPGGRFTPRVVQIGAQDGDLVEVLAGLEVGQDVVTHGNFLLDSESLLRASLAATGKN